jgi:hypothetical protein
MNGGYKEPRRWSGNTTNTEQRMKQWKYSQMSEKRQKKKDPRFITMANENRGEQETNKKTTTYFNQFPFFL